MWYSVIFVESFNCIKVQTNKCKRALIGYRNNIGVKFRQFVPIKSNVELIMLSLLLPLV